MSVNEFVNVRNPAQQCFARDFPVFVLWDGLGELVSAAHNGASGLFRVMVNSQNGAPLKKDVLVNGIPRVATVRAGLANGRASQPLG